MKKIALFIFCLIPAFYTHASSMKKNVAVFCSADDKVCAAYKTLAYDLGTQLARHDFGLVTGGSRTGLMKEVVDGYATNQSSLSHLHGILPQALAPFNVQHPAIKQENLKWTPTIHTRLSEFHAIADKIVVLPGGYGTLHELMDFLVHNQFGIHKTHILLVNIDGFWNHLIELFQVMADQQLVSPSHLKMLTLVSSVDECLQAINGSHETQDLTAHYWEQKDNK